MKKRNKTYKRKTNERRTNKRRTYKRRTNKRRSNKRRSNKRRSNKRRSYKINKKYNKMRGGAVSEKRPPPGAGGGAVSEKRPPPGVRSPVSKRGRMTTPLSPLPDPDVGSELPDSGNNLLFRVDVQQRDSEDLISHNVDLNDPDAQERSFLPEGADIMNVSCIYIQNSKCCVQLNLFCENLGEVDAPMFIPYITVAFLFKKSYAIAGRDASAGGAAGGGASGGGASVPATDETMSLVKNYEEPTKFWERNEDAVEQMQDERAVGVLSTTEMTVSLPTGDNLWNVDWNRRLLNPFFDAENPWTPEAQNRNLKCINFLFICLFMIIKTLKKQPEYSDSIEISLSAVCPASIYEAIGFTKEATDTEEGEDY
jgi:hypothetical protein